MKSFVLFAALSLRQDSGLEEALEGLRDSIAESEKFSERILAQGPAALEALRRQADVASGPFRERLRALIQEIERRQRVDGFQGKPAAISLDVESSRLADVASEIARQARVPVRLGTAPGEDPVTLRLERVPLLQALDQLCRAHGGIVLRWPRRGPAAALTLDRAGSGRPPRAFMGPYALEISSVAWSQVSDFGVDVSERLALQFHLTWDPALQPMSTRVVVTRWIEDGNGTACEDVTPSLSPPEHAWTSAPQQFSVEIQRRLPPNAKGFKAISGYLEATFPHDVETLRIGDPIGRRDVSVKGEKSAFTLVEFTRAERKCTGRFETEPHAGLRSRDIRLYDRTGKAWPGTWVRSSTDEIRSVFVADFPVPRDVDIVEARVSQAAPGPAVRIEWRIDDVRVR